MPRSSSSGWGSRPRSRSASVHPPGAGRQHLGRPRRASSVVPGPGCRERVVPGSDARAPQGAARL